ncbi:2511_t:CDS:2 [Gigaspora rosea]|nr:2511_t:CDS:2 [Gigaspora rosea]
MNHIEFQKLHIACISCRESKRKCIVDHPHPICERCRKNNLQCIYPDRKKSGPKKQQMPNQSHFTINPQLQSETSINLQVSARFNLRFDASPLINILASSTIDNLTLQFGRTYDGVYYVNSMQVCTIFNIPGIDDILKLGNGKRAPSTSFIIFRTIMQSCIISMNLRIDRCILSKHSSQIWSQLKTNDPSLVCSLRSLASDALRMFCKGNARIKMVCVPVTERIKSQEIGAHSSTLVADRNESDITSLLNDLFPSVL